MGEQLKRTAIVTGATSGIGFEISQLLRNKDYRVYGFGRDFSKFDGGDKDFIPVVCDFTDYNHIVKEIQKIKKEAKVSVLINCAGVGYFGLHEELNPKKIYEMVAVNLQAPLLFTQQFLRDIKQQEGFIINISSITAKESNPHGCAYGATKAALSSFSKSLFDEARKYGIKVVSIHPDMTKSNFYRNADFCEGDTEDAYLYANEVANTVAFVLSQRDAVAITDITLQPQRHRISRKKSENDTKN